MWDCGEKFSVSVTTLKTSLFQEQESIPFNRRQPVAYPERDYDDIEPSINVKQASAAERLRGSQEETHHQGQDGSKTDKKQHQIHDSSRNVPVANENSHSPYQSGLILSCVKNLPEETEVVGGRRPAFQTNPDPSYDIDDVANELIRLSEEQQSYDARL